MFFNSLSRPDPKSLADPQACAIDTSCVWSAASGSCAPSGNNGNNSGLGANWCVPPGGTAITPAWPPYTAVDPGIAMLPQTNPLESGTGLIQPAPIYFNGGHNILLATVQLPQCGVDYNIEVCMNLDTISTTANVNNLSQGSCVAEPTSANNRVCRTFFVHEPLPDVTARVLNRNDLLLRDMADTGVPVTGTPMDGSGVIVQITNIGEAPTTAAVWVDLYEDNLFKQRRNTLSQVAPNSSPINVFFTWQPASGANKLNVVIDDPSSFPCNTNPFGCEREYNDQVAGVDNNESDRELPDIDVAGISATKK